MTKDEFRKKYQEIIDWGIAEIEKVDEKLRLKGIPASLDGNGEDYDLINYEVKHRIRVLKEQYLREKED